MPLKSYNISIAYAVFAQGIQTGRLQKAIERTLKGENIKKADVSVVIVSDEEILKLNKAFLQHNYTTDVITFPLEENSSNVDGEIYISIDTARIQAKEYSVSLTNELTRLAVHGTLHLTGYDDATPEQRQQMHQLENKYIE